MTDVKLLHFCLVFSVFDVSMQSACKEHIYIQHMACSKYIDTVNEWMKDYMLLIIQDTYLSPSLS